MGSKKIKLVILTSGAKRHKFFANFLAEKFDVVGVVSEIKRPLAPNFAIEEHPVVAVHKKEIAEGEERHFGEHGAFNLPENRVLFLEFGHINDPDVFQWIKSWSPDYLALFGTDIIRPPLLNEFENRIINMHLGLSPYYRGSATSFWPLVYGEPECVGATIHLAIQKIDAGAILGQARPDIAREDNAQDIGCKNIIAGTELISRLIPEYVSGRLVPKPQDLSIGRVFKKKDFRPEAVLKMRENFANGMISDFLKNRDQRIAKYPIIE